MLIIKNNFMPFGRFAAINICGILFVRKDINITPSLIRHEKIHSKQIFEMFVIFFYLWYLIEWLIRLCMRGDAYKNISFDREAYANMHDANYLRKRSFRYKWFKYLRKR